MKVGIVVVQLLGRGGQNRRQLFLIDRVWGERGERGEPGVEFFQRVEEGSQSFLFKLHNSPLRLHVEKASGFRGPASGGQAPPRTTLIARLYQSGRPFAANRVAPAGAGNLRRGRPSICRSRRGGLFPLRAR